MGFFKQSGSFEPGDEIQLRRRAKIRVWSLFMEVSGAAIKASISEDTLSTTLAELPATLGRFVIQSVGERRIVVSIMPRPDAAFIGALTEDTSERSPMVSDEFTGITIAGPARVSYNGAMSTESWHQRQVPEFVVSGFHCFTPAQMRELPNSPDSAAKLIIHNSATGESVEQSVNFIKDSYQYDVVGISSSPGPERPWEPPEDDKFTSAGGYFDAPLGLFVNDPAGTPYELHVQAKCGAHASKTVTIQIA